MFSLLWGVPGRDVLKFGDVVSGAEVGAEWLGSSNSNLMSYSSKGLGKGCLDLPSSQGYALGISAALSSPLLAFVISPSPPKSLLQQVVVFRVWAYPRFSHLLLQGSFGNNEASCVKC